MSRAKHGYTKTPTHNIWLQMKQRCQRPTHQGYYKYGARGITVCLWWLADFRNFLADMGEKPEGRSINRIDNNGGYWCGHCTECLARRRPANCNWATPTEQAMNTRRNVNLTHDGKTQSLTAWAREYGIDTGTLRNRLRKGWPIERALSAVPSNSAYVYNLRILEFNGRRQSMTEWAKEIDVNPKALMSRIERGWSVERALTQPSRLRVGL